MVIGVLALQGAFIEHRNILERLGTRSIEIRQHRHFLKSFEGLIIPGGESTVMTKLLRELNLLEAIGSAVTEGMPVFGTCAGLILLSKEVEGKQNDSIPVLNTRVRRNAYGRQLGSFRTDAEFKRIGNIPMVFIRAPFVLKAYAGTEILATVDEKIVAVRQGRILATAFHPELTNDTRVHEYFLKQVCGHSGKPLDL
jgi:5'-phosphate synthase pdxT subunit